MMKKLGPLKAAVVALSGMVAAVPSSAQAPEVLTIAAENVTRVGEGEGGAGTVVRPGDEVRYRLTFTNRESTPVRNVVLSNPISGGMTYVAGSAVEGAGVRVAFSIDGGATYSARPLVERVVDGRVEQVPAPASSYTHVRWTLGEWVQPGEQVDVEFRAVLQQARREQ